MTPVRAALRPRSWPAPWADVVGSWLAARVVVLGVLLAVAWTGTVQEGLLGWDADWYLRIARDGYGGVEQEGLRFFPVLPLFARVLALPLGGSEGAALLLLANAGALLYGWSLHRLALSEGLGEGAARRVVWVAALAPAATVLVMGYTEPLYGALVVGVLMGARRRRWWLVAALGLLAGASRPTGVLLALPVLVEAARGLRGLPPGPLVARAAAVAAPAVGLASYLLWVGVRFGDPLLPFTIQTTPGLRGGLLTNPLPGVLASLAGRGDGDYLAPALHLPFLALAVALLVLSARRLPASFTAYAAVTVLLAATARELQSFERYASSAVPLLLVAALLLRTRVACVTAGLTGLVLLGGYSWATFARLVVP